MRVKAPWGRQVKCGPFVSCDVRRLHSPAAFDLRDEAGTSGSVHSRERLHIQVELIVE